MAPDAKYVKTKIIAGDAPDFRYPEAQLAPVAQKQNWGLAFSGGGTRSATLTLGQLRALRQIGILDQFRYCSSVSGGTWGVTPFIFLDPSISDEQFLGSYKAPQDISLDDLSADDPKSMASAISRSKIVKSAFSNMLEGDELFSKIVGDIFLKPFLINENLFFTFNDETLQRILTENTNLTHNDFYTTPTERKRPFLIVNSTILRSVEMRIPFEMTPLYCGIKQLYPNAGSNERYDIGGGFVEPHGFDSDSPDTIENDVALVRLHRNRLSISDMLGSSGAAPADVFRRFLPMTQPFPNFNYWAPTATGDRLREKAYDFGDGGLLENLGIMSLLRRKVEKIVVFVNGKTKIQKQDETSFIISDSIPALFKSIPNQYGDRDFDKNVVLANDNSEYVTLANDLFEKQRRGLPTVHFGTYSVKANAHHDIQGGWQVKICWVYNSMPTKWFDQLRYDVKSNLTNDKYGKDFPYFNTFMENFPHIIDLSLEETQLASQLSSWMLMDAADDLVNFLQR